MIVAQCIILPLSMVEQNTPRVLLKKVFNIHIIVSSLSTVLHKLYKCVKSVITPLLTVYFSPRLQASW